MQALGRREGNKLRNMDQVQSLLYTGKAIYWEASDAIDHLIIGCTLFLTIPLSLPYLYLK